MNVTNIQFKNILFRSAINSSIGNHSQVKSSSPNYSPPQRISNESLVIFVLFILGVIFIACGLLIFSLNQAKSANESVFDKDIQLNNALEIG